MNKIYKNTQGQITIFFATTMFVVISFIAFIINIGIFVKAKINLQNAVDSAAFAGAAVQARQLTNIAYLNWEMRNVYKEWMFKYYVLGNLNIDDVANGASGTTDFTMATYQLGTNTATDRYNFPSVCLDFAQAGGVSVCTNYVISGLPRFSPTNVGGATDETLNTMLDTLIVEKGKDCANRSAINYAITSLWAYNVKTSGSNLMQQSAPQIASDRPGAFPTAFELAIRMRSLEAFVNRAPYSNICFKPNDLNSDFCNQEIENLIASDRSPSNERITKAFYSGFRNLGSEEDTELRSSFTLTELPPTRFRSENDKDLSNLLIPASSNARDKYYLDLKLMTVNLATFYTQFTMTSGDVNVQGVEAGTEGQCAATKTGLPVPGYPLGYVKNPDVLTYYAVKGQAKFIGLFNPFDIGSTNGITLTAFAAAKPFGGRIGPKIFKIDNTDTASVTPRAVSGSNKFLSSAYTSGINLSSLVDQYGNAANPNQYQPGSILPLSIDGGNDFWLSEPTQTVGGWISSGAIVFSVPNIVYDYPGNDPASQDYFSPEKIQILETNNPTSMDAGLYNAEMFEKFAQNLRNRGGNVQPQDVNDAILKVRAPTRYETNNYLIPTPENINEEMKLDSFGHITDNSPQQIGQDGHLRYNFQLFAPMYGQYSDSLYKSFGDVLSVLNSYLGFQKVSIEKYVQSMNTAAYQIANDTANRSGATNTNLATGPASKISDIDFTSDPVNQTPSCQSMAGLFAYFYLGKDHSEGVVNNTGCNPNNHTTLYELMREYLMSNQDTLGETYRSEFILPPEGDDHPSRNELFSAYRPGVGNDAPANDGVFKNFLRGSTINMFRNFYSTKFSSLNSLLVSPKEPGASYTRGNFTTFSEGNYTIMQDISQNEIVNGLDLAKVGVELKNIQH